MVSSRLSYDREVVDRTVLTSQSVPPAPPWQLGGAGWRTLVTAGGVYT